MGENPDCFFRSMSNYDRRGNNEPILSGREKDVESYYQIIKEWVGQGSIVLSVNPSGAKRGGGSGLEESP